METVLHGRCLCGSVRFEYEGEVGNSNYCHCDDCQRATGGPYTISVQVQTAKLRIVTGKVKGYTKTGDSGRRITRAFCPKCGSPLFTKGEKDPEFVYLKAGCIEESEFIKPSCQKWTTRARPWAYIDDNIPCFPGNSPSQIEKGKTISAKSAEDYLKEGDIYRKRKKWHEAVNAYSRAIELDNNDFRSFERQARAYFELGDYQQTISNLTKAIEIKPDRYLLYDLRGRAHSMLGNRDSVKVDFDMALTLHSRHNVYLHKALSFSKLGYFDQAISDLNRAIALNADYAYAYLNRGILYQKLGKIEHAKSDYQRTIELSKNQHWSTRARAYLNSIKEDEL